MNIDSVALLNTLPQDIDDADYEKLKSDLCELFSDQEKRTFETFLAPSGTDLVYFPLLFKQILERNKKIIYVISCPEELGGGTTVAAAGSFYARKSQFGTHLNQRGPLNSHLEVELVLLSARDVDGNIMGHEDAIVSIIENKEPDTTIIVNLVIGSKSGIEDNLSLIPKYKEEALFVVDMCQMRVTNELINNTINDGACVMVTGSKFFQAPPFCAAFLVPETLVDQIEQQDVSIEVDGFNRVFSRQDFPSRLEKLRAHFPNFINHGLFLRWKIAINEIQWFNKVDTDRVLSVIDLWNQTVSDNIKRRPQFELMKDYDLTNKSIVSFRVLDNNGKYLSHSELQKLYSKVILNLNKEIGYKKLQIGQPVKYGDKSFIRLSIGAVNIREFIAKGFDVYFEESILQVIANAAESQ